MSCILLGRAHIDYLVRGALAYAEYGWPRYDGEPLTLATANAVGAALYAANAEAYLERYADNEGISRDKLMADALAFTLLPVKARTVPIEPVQLLNALDCYEYQTSDWAGWERSREKAFCDEVRGRTIKRLPGYDKCVWVIGW